MDLVDREAAVEEFWRHRPRLLGLAYRLLGSMWDAEDVVADALLRWLDADRSRVREPVAYLSTVVSRLALDLLRSARVRRETYVGPWLPEPALTDTAAFGPLDTVERRDTLSLAMLRMMERLTPPERAVFVLREAFDLPYDQIAGMLELKAAHARQLYHRARDRVADGRERAAASDPASTVRRGATSPSAARVAESKRFQLDGAEHARLLERFLDASNRGDLDGLRDLLAAEVVSYSDGGGKVRAALRPITGADAVLRFFLSLARKYPAVDIQWVEANGRPAAYLERAGIRQLVAVHVTAGRITEIYDILNPEKISYLERQLTTG
jgi:RNA polymerase sigma-70 factor (ECF subfamily)